MQAGTSYHESTAHIVAGLGAGTTKGNPELTAQWNSAQSALDALTTNINALSALANEVANDSSTAHYESDTIQATFNVSGAVDEDHRQLSVLANETRRTIIVVDSLMSDVNDAVQRQTAYVTGERGNLTTLASAIKAGKYSAPMVAAPGAAAMSGAMAAGEPIVTIKFARAHVSYDRVLYAALSHALAAQPHASFSVVAVAPTSGDTAAVQLAQNSAQRNAQAVMHSMTEMGVPATRMDTSSSTDPDIAASEVRVYVK
jgi:phosphohistidine swiveling domain-containing protein